MSHHLPTPEAPQRGQLFIDDMYVFDGDGCTVLMMDVNSNVTGAEVMPGFHPEARYEFRIHLDGAPREELTYRVTFAPMSDGQQAYEVHELQGRDAEGDNAGGRVVASGRTGAPSEGGAVRVWAGRIDDPFYIDLDELFVINAAVRDGSTADLTEWRAGRPKNSFAGTQVYTIVLEVPHDHPRLRPGARIGVWCATKLADAEGWHQVNRFGLPMMWPIFWPDDLDFSNPADRRHPAKDFDEDGAYIAEKIAAFVAANGGNSTDPAGYGQLVARRIFPEVMPYTVGTPASFGFTGINGRALADNAPEVMFSLVMDSATSSGLDPSVAADMRRDEFPWVVPAR
ncbi:DUF4331 family protein [Asanoa siamensis]|uniref:DUF4331 domain-containing protein n=1 Tax=Asanoa siamensis TaxID=926357 RepID=A0ABQ4CZ64_9ACTN|nr:DUF4331 family protein [Asanoa siamensis]GIF76569.1 hypothetical protein Asi02nite_60870 [Asanoa siamensis]